MAEEERRNSMEREVSGICSSSSGACEPSSSLASSSVAVAGEESDAQERQGRNVGEFPAAAEQSSPVRESVSADQSIEDVKWRNMDSVVNELLFLAQKFPQWPQGDDDGGSQNNITSDNSTAGGGEVIVKDGLNEAANISVVAAGTGAGEEAVVAVIIAACNGTISEGKKKRKRSRKNQSSSSSSSAHICEVCGKTFAMGQSLGGHKRKHYEGQLTIKKKRAREEREEKPAPAAEGRVQSPVMVAAEERMASFYNAPFKSHDRALLPQAFLSQSVQGDFGRNREEEPEGPGPWLSAANEARRPPDFDLNEPGLSEPEWKDHDGDEALLSFRLGQFDFQRSN